MTRINAVTEIEIVDGVAIVAIDSPPVNALSAGVREGLYKGVLAASGDDRAAAIVIMCGGRTFIAGADIRELGKPKTPPTLADAQRVIENAPKPVIAAIHGNALGGGLEVALCAHYRLATTSACLGLPEVKLGLLAGAGGTQRLPRVVGVEDALEMMTSGQSITAVEALARGLVNDLVIGNLKDGAIAFAQRIARQQHPLLRVRDDDSKLGLTNADAFFADFRQRHAEGFRGLRAPEAIVRCVEAAVNKPWDEAIQVERALFADLLVTPEAAALRYGFVAERRSRKPPGSILSPIELPNVRIADRSPLIDSLIRSVAKPAGEPLRIKIGAPDTATEPGVLLFDATATTRPAREYLGVLRALIGKSAAIAAVARPSDYALLLELAKCDSAILYFCVHEPLRDRRLIEIGHGANASPERLAAAIAAAQALGGTPVLVSHGTELPSARMLDRLKQTIIDFAAQGIRPERVRELLAGFGFEGGLLRLLPTLTCSKASPRTDDETILARSICVLIDEAVRLIDDGRIGRACDIDVLSQAGLGWPPWRGGPMWYGDRLGAGEIIATLEQAEKVQGRQYRPPRSLVHMMAGNDRLIDLVS